MKVSINYHITRKTVLDSADEYLNALNSEITNSYVLNQLQNNLLSFKYNEIIILQSELKKWESIISLSSVYFRMNLLFNLFNINQTDLGKLLNKKRAIISHYTYEKHTPTEPDRYNLAMILSHPFQIFMSKDFTSRSLLIHELDYLPLSQTHIPFISLKECMKKYNEVKTISLFIIKDLHTLLPVNDKDVFLGRWVTSMPEYHYFEIIIPNEPTVRFDGGTCRKIKKLFPTAKMIITTYLPFRRNYRAIWILIPIGETHYFYHNFVFEMKHFREQTEVHQLP